MTNHEVPEVICDTGKNSIVGIEYKTYLIARYYKEKFLKSGNISRDCARQHRNFDPCRVCKKWLALLALVVIPCVNNVLKTNDMTRKWSFLPKIGE